jgi:hypothetical protein
MWLNTLKKEGVSKSFRTGRLERELQMVQLSATRCSCIAILWVSLVRFAAITLCVAPQRVFIVVVYFVIDSVRKFLDTPSYVQEHRRYRAARQKDGRKCFMAGPCEHGKEFSVSIRVVNFLTRWVTVSFSWRTLLHGKGNVVPVF